MEIVDTVYLIAYLNPENPLHKNALKVVEGLGDKRRVSQAALIELDLIMKSRGFSLEERRDTWILLSAVINGHVEPLLPSDFALAARLSEAHGLDYFDSLVSAQCINRLAKPLTTDSTIIKIVESALRQTA